jgi:hypothetical protein
MTNDADSTEQITGARGETGIPGRQGEAGVSGRQGEAGTTGLTGLQGAVGAVGQTGLTGESGNAGETGTEGEAGARGPRGRTGHTLSPWQLYTVLAFVVGAFIVLSVGLSRQARSIQHQQEQIRRDQYAQCTLRNQDNDRRNTSIDSAIAAEKRKPVPDQRRITELAQTKSRALYCGPNPG